MATGLCKCVRHVVLRLIDPYVNNGRNTTTDNFFTSFVEKILVKSTSFVGTMNRKRKEITTKSKIGYVK